MKFLIIASLSESLINFRGPLISALQRSGLEVHVAAPHLKGESRTRAQLEAGNVVVHDIPLLRAGTNPISDLQTLFAVWKLIRREKPSFVLCYTIKPVIYGGLAARLGKVRHYFALITGLGYAFQGDGNRSGILALAQWLYRLGLSKASLVFFQNPDDLALFRDRRILNENATALVVNGSGVDVAEFALKPQPKGSMRFLLIARLLGDKGVREYAAAARIVKITHPDARFSLAGWIDSNPNAISQKELNEWISDGTVEFLGQLADVRPAIAACNVYVLPSYREGTPRTVLEAMAMGRPVITTDAPGCRETVVEGSNGFLVPVKSPEALAAAMRKFLDTPQLASEMGIRARQIAEEKYDVHKVNTVMLDAMGIH